MIMNYSCTALDVQSQILIYGSTLALRGRFFQMRWVVTFQMHGAHILHMQRQQQQQQQRRCGLYGTKANSQRRCHSYTFFMISRYQSSDFPQLSLAAICSLWYAKSLTTAFSTYSTRLPAWNRNSGDSERMYEPRKRSERFSRLLNSYMFQMRPETSARLLFENLTEGSWYCSSVFLKLH